VRAAAIEERAPGVTSAVIARKAGMTRTSSKDILQQDPKQDQRAPADPPVLAEGTGLAPEPPPTLTEDNRLAPAPADRGAGSCADGHDEGHPPSDAAALTGDNGGGTSGNHGNGTAG